ncbi:hypothetical protein DK150_550088 [Flavobacterium psychrophilum]|uniref:hypothetical protein n=1 Tax=Flavobacterium psychrophilum TaxID=96345 RepID=UPI000B7C1ADA|nr:hypothetical protein [Flavobacterium psychrophilum]SNA83480.1 hypothetical protein DK150_550088 [Flavobacterium psychrophilum]
MDTIFDIEQKQNSQEMLDYAKGKPTKFFLFADEFNDTARKALEAAVHDVKLDFSWSNKTEHRISTPDGVDSLQLLVMDFRAEWMLENTDQVWLVIDRYKPKKTERVNSKCKESGFKHDYPRNNEKRQRPSEIWITSKQTVLNIFQQYYFTPFNNVLFGKMSQEECYKKVKNGYGIRASGYGSKNRKQNNKAWVYLQFSIKVRKGNNIFYSNPKATIQMICHRDYNKKIHISYRLQ